ncbi:MAG: hypothetical protein ACI9KF_001699, partial [Arenicella sp.]
TTPMFGSIVQKGKLALCAFAFDKQLNKVDFPTFGNPTIPAFIFFGVSIKKVQESKFDNCHISYIHKFS